jgi:nucleotide-binding universal stress UspA family protein
MYKKVLLPTDGSPISRKAVKQGVAFAKSIGAKVVGFFSADDYRTGTYAVYVASAYPLSRTEFEAEAKEAARKQLAVVERAAAQAGVPYEGVYKMSSEPWQAFIEAAKEKKCDLIFMGSHGRRGLAGVVLGSQTTKVLTHSKIPVLVAR